MNFIYVIATTALKLYQPPRSVLEKHYEDLSAKPFFPGMIDYMQSGPVCCMVRVTYCTLVNDY